MGEQYASDHAEHNGHYQQNQQLNTNRQEACRSKLWHRNLSQCINGWGEWQNAERNHPCRAHGAHRRVDAAEELHRLVQQATEVVRLTTGDKEDRREADAERVHGRHARQDDERQQERVGNLVLRPEEQHARERDDHGPNDHAEGTANRHAEGNCTEADWGGDVEKEVPRVALPVKLRPHHPDH